MRTYKVDIPDVEKVCLRAREIRERAGMLTGYALGEGEDADGLAELIMDRGAGDRAQVARPDRRHLGRVQLDHLTDGQRDALVEAADCP